jgi:uncharacterized membrane protein
MGRLGAGRGTSAVSDRPPGIHPGPAVSPAPTARDGDDLLGEDRLPPWVRSTGWGLLGVQLVAMLVFSTVQYRRFALTGDFANYSQAWWAIAHGNLDPYVSGVGTSFWKNNAEFAMWPLALLGRVYPHPVTLLWVQDLAVVATELVTFRWILDAIGRSRGRIPAWAGPLLGVGAAGALVANPWVYDTIAFDFHFEPIAALFCVLVGYDLWAGRVRRLWFWVPLALISTGLAAVYLVGVGFSGIVAGRKTRRSGAMIAAIGAGWFLVLSTVGGIGVGGKTFSASYGYLVGAHHGRIAPLDVAVGVLLHPGAVLQVAGAHATVVVAFLVVVGAIGVLSPWGLGMALVVLVPNILDNTGHFIHYGGSFQSWPAMPFVLVGSVMVLLRLFEGNGRHRRVAAVILLIWATVLGELSGLDVPTIPGSWIVVDPAAAAVLTQVAASVPPDAEVIVSEGIVGRFAQRESVYAFGAGGQTFPVDRRLVVFVFGPPDGYELALTSSVITAASGYVHHRLDARILRSRSGVEAFAWSPRAGTTTVTLPR